MFHAGQEINSLGGKEVHFTLVRGFQMCWNAAFNPCSQMDLAFLSWDSNVTSVVRCLSLFEPLPYRAHCLCAENLLVVTLFTQTKKLNAQNETRLLKSTLPNWCRVVMSLEPIRSLTIKVVLMRVAMTWKEAVRKMPPDCNLSFSLYLSQGQTRAGSLSSLQWNCFTGELPGTSTLCASGWRCLAYLTLKHYCTIHKANPLCSCWCVTVFHLVREEQPRGHLCGCTFNPVICCMSLAGSWGRTFCILN